MTKQLRLFKMIDGVKHSVVLTVEETTMMIEREEVAPTTSQGSDDRKDYLTAKGIEFHEEGGTIHIDKVPPEMQQVLRFFSESTPCWFPACAELRRRHKEEIEKLATDCPPCEQGALTRKYSELVRKELFGE
jgi:hypothetical protein